jgi:lipoprotein NlpD
VGSARAVLALSLLLCACAHRRVVVADEPAAHDIRHGVFHRVLPGETLYRIGRAYGVEAEALQRENAIHDPAQLEVGSLLFIPGADHAVDVPPPDAPLARIEQRPQRRASPAQIPRAGVGALDPAAHGEPLAWPLRGVLISGFGTRDRDQHEGLDLAAPEGTPVLAAAGGEVLFAGEQRGYGNLVLLGHDRGLVTVYAHNSANLVATGDRVERGQAIARVGRTGKATGPHLHFEVRVGARPRDPLGFLR